MMWEPLQSAILMGNKRYFNLPANEIFVHFFPLSESIPYSNRANFWLVISHENPEIQ